MDPWALALPRLVAAASNVALGMLVFFARPDRRQNQLLAVMMLLNGVIHGGIGLFPILPAAHVYSLQAPVLLAMVLYVGTYLVFTGTLDTPLSRPFRTRSGIAAIVLVAGAFAATLLFVRDLWYEPVLPWPTDPIANGWETVFEGHALKKLLELAIVLHFLFGLIVALHAFQRAQTPSERRKMKWFAVAFVSHDILLALTFAAPLVAAATGTACHTCNIIGFFPVISLAGVLMAVFLAYGILSTQLFDIDLKIKWTLRRGTVAAIFVAAILVATEGAQVTLGERNPWVGIAAAAILVFALSPLQRFADHLAERAMPRVQDTEEYRTVRKRGVYQAAFEAARKDGRVTERERDVLAALADELGLSAGDARALERGGRGLAAEAA